MVLVAPRGSVGPEGFTVAAAFMAVVVDSMAVEGLVVAATDDN